MPDRAHSSRRAACALAGAALSIVAITACGDADPSATSTETSAPMAATPQTEPTVPAPTTSDPPASTAAPATDPPATTAPPTTSPATTSPPATLSGATVEVSSALMPNPFVLERVGAFGDLVVYDGESVDGDFALRCVIVGHEGDTSWSEWCALPGDNGSFVVVDDIDPWVVDVGSEPLDVTLAKQPSAWAVTSSGCVEPLVTLIEAADIEPAVATALACVDDEAFLSFASVFMQRGPADGGGMLLTKGDEGWNSSGPGTSFDCASWPDGVDRCGMFGVEYEMFEATSPLPSPDLIRPAEQFVGLRQVTDEIREMAAPGPDETLDIDAITEKIVAGVTIADAEVPPTIVRHDGVSFDQYSLLVIDVPAADDSIASTTWAVWITTETPEVPATIHRAYTWENCARGVAAGEPPLCI